MIRIVLIDEQRLFSEAVRAIVETEPDMQVVGTVTSEHEIVTCLEETEPHVILIDIHLLAEGLSLITEIKQRYPQMKIIYLTADVERDLIIGAMIAGAHGFLDRNLTAQRLVWSVREAMTDQVVISGDVAQTLVEEIITLSYDHREELRLKLHAYEIELTERELDVALLLMQEYSNRAIATELRISEGTTKNYVSTIYDKINIRYREEAIQFFRQLFVTEPAHDHAVSF